MLPEQCLAAAILQQAFRDMMAATVQQNAGQARPYDREANEAIRFLTDRRGHKAQWRNRWCSYLDLDGDVLAERVRRMLDGDLAIPHTAGDSDPQVYQRSVAAHNHAVERARERWLHLK